MRISGGENHDNATTGQVEMYNNNKWVSVCADGFDKFDARVVCRELGFPNSKALIPGAFGSKYYVDSILNLNCTGKEASISACGFEIGICPDRAYNYASVLCSKYPVDENGEFYQMNISVFNVRGKVSPKKIKLFHVQWINKFLNPCNLTEPNTNTNGLKSPFNWKG